jgi:hypothetical protein
MLLRCAFIGVVLRMARLIKDGSIKGGKCDDVKDAANKAPIKTLIILANDLVQVIAKVCLGFPVLFLRG